MAKARHGVALADASSSGKIVVEGSPSEAVLQVTWATPPVNIGQGVIGDSGHLYRLRKDLFFTIRDLQTFTFGGLDLTFINRL